LPESRAATRRPVAGRLTAAESLRCAAHPFRLSV